MCQINMGMWRERCLFHSELINLDKSFAVCSNGKGEKSPISFFKTDIMLGVMFHGCQFPDACRAGQNKSVARVPNQQWCVVNNGDPWFAFLFWRLASYLAVDQAGC